MSITAAQQDLEAYFKIATYLGPIFVPLSDDVTLDEVRDGVYNRATAVWPTTSPAYDKDVYVRLFYWHKEIPRVADDFPPLTDLANAAIDGLIQAQIFQSKKQVFGLWTMRDSYPNLPFDLLSVQVAWGP